MMTGVGPWFAIVHQLLHAPATICVKYSVEIMEQLLANYVERGRNIQSDNPGISWVRSTWGGTGQGPWICYVGGISYPCFPSFPCFLLAFYPSTFSIVPSHVLRRAFVLFLCCPENKERAGSQKDLRLYWRQVLSHFLNAQIDSSLRSLQRILSSAHEFWTPRENSWKRSGTRSERVNDWSSRSSTFL